MKNKKKGVLIAVVVIALIVAAVAAVCINKKAGDSGKLKEGQTETTVKKSDTKVITFAVPDICRIDENNLKQFNAALMSDGYNYELNIKYLEYDEYSQKLESAFAAGETDVAFLGLGDENGNNPVYDLISSDLVLNLDDVLSKDQGKTQRIFGRWQNVTDIFIPYHRHLQMIMEFMLHLTGIISQMMS